uniref:Uncharacterized protein n=1 Tax=Leersia perrieri TaxID=77586 RepID=A0A0D9WQ89_9ORYZ
MTKFVSIFTAPDHIMTDRQHEGKNINQKFIVERRKLRLSPPLKAAAKPSVPPPTEEKKDFVYKDYFLLLNVHQVLQGV